jgi:hypothetical protein
MKPAVTLLGCLCGMAIGLWFDGRTMPLEVLASLCAGGSSFLRSLALHWTTMPAAHGLMLVGAMTPVLLVKRPALGDFFSEGLCSITMAAGMSLGGTFAGQMSELFALSAFGGLLVAMMAGMGGGFVLALLMKQRPGSFGRRNARAAAMRTGH